MEPYRNYTFKKDTLPVFSIVIPIYNQENIIVKNVK